VVEGGDSEVISAKTQALIQASMKLGEAMYAAQQKEGGEGPASDADAARADGAQGGEDVVDAEFEEVDGDDHKKSA
jgi:molecular chaperone DnaK